MKLDFVHPNIAEEVAMREPEISHCIAYAQKALAKNPNDHDMYESLSQWEDVSRDLLTRVWALSVLKELECAESEAKAYERDSKLMHAKISRVREGLQFHKGDI